jgi:hypothetical protein
LLGLCTSFREMALLIKPTQMNVMTKSHITSPASMPPEAMQKRRAYSAITEASDEEDGESTRSLEDAKMRLQQAACTTAGLFIDNPAEKPLPLSFQRSIPLPRFWKRSSRYDVPTTSVPDILRRTSAKVPQESCVESLSSRRRNDWVCPHCNHGNSSTVSCALCGELHELTSTSPTTRSTQPTEDTVDRIEPTLVRTGRKAMPRSYSAHYSSTRDENAAYRRCRSMSESDDF